MPGKKDASHLTQLLSTKLFVPPFRQQIIFRPRLTEQLDQAADYKLTLISAPAGFGKTTLLSEWIHYHNMLIAWFSIDKTDNDPAQFLSYTITALQKIDNNIGKSVIPLLKRPQLPQFETLITNLINDLTASLEDFFFILEDYHFVENRRIHEIVEYLLEHMPQKMHVFIVTRSDPPFPLGRFRARSQLIELRALDLRFSENEISQLFKKIFSLELTEEEISTLSARTEGWIAGLQMAALSMRGMKDITTFIKDFAGDDRHIMDYLLEEVLNRQPESIKSFLLQTSILERLSGSLCNAVTSRNNCWETLIELEKTNLFLVPLDNKRLWYRYHHLFADLLRVHLRQFLGDMVPELHHRASKWYELNDFLSEAIAHSMAAKNFKQAARLTQQSFDDRMSHDEDFTTMLHRLEALPEEIIRNSPRLHIMYAWMLSITLQLDKVEPCLQEIERQNGNQLPSDLRLQVAHIRAELARHKKDFSKAIKLSEKVLASLPENLSVTGRQTYTGAVFNLAWSLFEKGEVEKAEAWFTESLKIDRAAGSITLILLAIRGLVLAQIYRGQLNKASENTKQGFQLIKEAAQKSGQTAPAAAYIHICMGDLLYELNNLQEAEYHLKLGIELCEASQIDAETHRDSYLSLVRLKQAQGYFNVAQDVIRKAVILAQGYQSIPNFNDPIAACRARLALAKAKMTGEKPNFDQAGQWIEERGLEIDVSVESLFNETEYLVWARLLIAKNEISQTLQLLNQLLPKAEKAGRKGRVIEILILQALALHKQGNTNEALPVLERALGLAQSEGYIRLFLDEGQSAAHLLEIVQQKIKRAKKEAADKLVTEYVKKLLLEFKVGVTLKKDEVLPDALSDRELEVLRCIGAGLSNKDIAQKLFISLDTVKSHTKNINSKLDVHSRTEAIAEGKRLGYL